MPAKGRAEKERAMYEQPTFFENDASQPLAARLRPRTLDEFAGQKHLLGEGKVLRRIIESDNVGIKEIKQVMEQAEKERRFGGKTILFVDEIHRFNKAQQDAFLPYVEKGSIILIGATTENPSFEVNGALISRCKVLVLQALKTEEVKEL